MHGTGRHRSIHLFPAALLIIAAMTIFSDSSNLVAAILSDSRGGRITSSPLHIARRSRLAFAGSLQSSKNNNNNNNRQTQQSPPSEQHKQQQHLVLIGGGHAHVQVIKALNDQARPSHLKVTLIDRQKSASYSGMVPGCIANYYTPDETLLHLEPLAQWAGMDFVHDRVVDVDLDNKHIYLSNNNSENNPISFDALSIDIGSTSRDVDIVPGVRQYTIPTRPIYRLIERLDHARMELRNKKHAPHLVVVGGGVAGIELSMSVTSRWRKEHPDMSCTLLNTGTALLPLESDAARRKLQEVLDAKGIRVQHDAVVREVTKDCIELVNGQSIPYTHCVWATGAAAHPLARHLHTVRHLDATKNGWIQVQPTLQSTSHPFVFAAGDCASIEGLAKGSPPKAGVYAVRAGPVLIENLTRFLAGRPLVEYEPQDDFLKILACGDKKALGFRFGLALSGEWVWNLKDHIDQNFMNLFRVDHLPKKEQRAKQQDNDGSDDGNEEYDTSQYDAMEDMDALPRLEPEIAASLLHREDNGIDYLEAWRTLRAMARDSSYRDAVVAHVEELNTVGASSSSSSSLPAPVHNFSSTAASGRLHQH